jgi:hypothetical protein
MYFTDDSLFPENMQPLRLPPMARNGCREMRPTCL